MGIIKTKVKINKRREKFFMRKIVKNKKRHEKKNIVKKQTGITLIALVITIIVLLILAGVSIAMLTGNNGILTQANQAKENTKVATAKEKVQIEAAGSLDNTGVFSKAKFKENLKENLKLTDSDIVDNADGTMTVKIDGYDVTVDGTTGKVTGIKALSYELGEPDEKGRRRPVEIKGSEHEIPCDAVIVALGNNSNPLIPATTPEINVDDRGHITVDESQETSMTKVWAGGDIVLGAATVILAMGEGRKAAASINEYLAK